MNRTITFQIETDELMEVLNSESNNNPSKYVSDMINAMLKRFLKSRLSRDIDQKLKSLSLEDKKEIYNIVKQKHGSKIKKIGE